MALTTQNIKGFTCPSDKNQVKKADGNGLFLLVKKNNSKLWRLRYKFVGKHQEMALGKYPTVSLHEARKMTQDARVILTSCLIPT